MKDGSGAHAWTTLPRVRFHDLWDDLPLMTIVVALPGWGATEWMRQCRDRRTVADARWVDTRAALDAVLASSGALPPEVYVDDVLTGRDDDAWQALAAVAAQGVRVVATSPDLPPAAIGADVGTRVLVEGDLALDEDEIGRIVEINRIAIGTDTRAQLATALRGCPLLVRAQVERLRRRRADSVWASLAFALERPLLDPLAAGPSEGGAPGAFAAMLRAGFSLRRFSVDLVGSGEAADARDFARLEAYPIGDVDADDETGAAEFVWSDAAWSALDDLLPGPRRRAGLAEGAERLRERGRIVARLFPLIALGRFDDADALVFDGLRRFLLFTDGPTQDALLAAAPDCIAQPSLQLLASELRLRVHGANAQSVDAAARSLEAFRGTPADPPMLRFRLHARSAMAAALAGRREAAVRHLDAIRDIVDPASDSRVRRLAAEDRGAADIVAADLFPAFWAAVQTDRHEHALVFAAVMKECGDPSSIVTRIDRLTAMTEEDFAGLRSLSPDAARPEELEYSHAAALVLLEEGEDAEAVERTHPLASRTRHAPTRSAADALLVLARGIAAPGTPGAAVVEATLARSAGFWDDGEPSTFIAFAATVATLSAGETPAWRPRARDWFTAVARALEHLSASRPGDAVAALDDVGRSTLPRLAWVQDLLTATALLRLDLVGAAETRLTTAWTRVPAPRLVRFAARFVSADDFSLLRAASARIGGPLRAAFDAAAPDRRPLGTAVAIALTPAERDLLALLRRGAANGEIAAARGTTMNTVRTQLRTLYRKIGVADRTGAAAFADRVLGDRDAGR